MRGEIANKILSRLAPSNEEDDLHENDLDTAACKLACMNSVRVLFQRLKGSERDDKIIRRLNNWLN